MKQLLFAVMAASILFAGCQSTTPKEVLIAHILIKCPPNSSRAAHGAAQRRLVFARAAIVKNAVSFQQSARESSECPSKSKGGLLDWINIEQAKAAGNYPGNFLATAASLKPGQVSGIIRTEHGYHLLKCYAVR